MKYLVALGFLGMVSANDPCRIHDNDKTSCCATTDCGIANNGYCSGDPYFVETIVDECICDHSDEPFECCELDYCSFTGGTCVNPGTPTQDPEVNDCYYMVYTEGSNKANAPANIELKGFKNRHFTYWHTIDPDLVFEQGVYHNIQLEGSNINLRIIKESDCTDCSLDTSRWWDRRWNVEPVSSVPGWEDLFAGPVGNPSEKRFAFAENGTYYYLNTMSNQMIGKIVVLPRYECRQHDQSNGGSEAECSYDAHRCLWHSNDQTCRCDNGYECVSQYVWGCKDRDACNYNPDATADDGSCTQDCGGDYLDPDTDLLQICMSANSYISSTIPYGDDYLYYCKCNEGYSPKITKEGTDSYMVSSTEWSYLDRNGNDIRTIDNVNIAVEGEETTTVECIISSHGCMDKIACNYDESVTIEIPNSCVYASMECQVCENGVVVYKDEDGDGTCDGEEEPPLDPVTDLQRICQTDHASIEATHVEGTYNLHTCDCDEGYVLSKNGNTENGPWTYTDYYYRNDTTTLTSGYACHMLGCMESSACNYDASATDDDGSCATECDVCENGVIVHSGVDEHGDGICDDGDLLDPQTNSSQICQIDHTVATLTHIHHTYNEYTCKCDEGYDLLEYGITSTVTEWKYKDNYYTADTNTLPDGSECAYVEPVDDSGSNKVLSGLVVLASVCANYIHLS